MSTTDPNSIEYLSLEIKSSTEEAVKALNALTEALDKVITSTSSLKDAAANVLSFGKSLSGLASGIRSTISTSKELSFSGADSEARELDKTVNRLTKDTLAAFGITGKRALSDYRKAFTEVIKEYQDTGDVTDSFKTAGKFIEDNTKLVDESKASYREFANEIDRLIKNGKKVHVGFGYGDLGAGTDVDAAKKTLGRLFTRGDAVDFEMWAQELADQFQGVISVGENTAETVNNIVKAYQTGKDAYLDYKKAINSPASIGGTEGYTAEDAILGDLDRVIGKSSELKKSVVYGGVDNNAFRVIADSVSELNGVNSSNMEQIVNSVNSVKSLDTKGVVEAAKALSQLGNSLGKISLPEGGSNIGQFIESLYVPLKTFEGLKLPSFKPLMELQKALSGFSGESYTIAFTNLEGMVPAIKSFSEQVSQISFGGTDALNETIKSIAKFGHANMEKAIANMPNLSSALKELVSQLNQLPEVNDKTLRLVEALGQLKLKGLDANKELTRASGGMNLFGKAAHKARGHTNGLIGTLVKARAVIYALRRAFDALKGSINLASDLIEVQNVVDVTFGNYQSHLEGIAKNSIEAYGTSELTFKSVASQFQAMGSAMGIGNSQMREATENLKGMGVAYGETTGQMGDMATTLTELSADMASFYNKDIEDVQTAMTSVYTGQTRPLKVAA